METEVRYKRHRNKNINSYGTMQQTLQQYHAELSIRRIFSLPRLISNLNLCERFC